MAPPHLVEALNYILEHVCVMIHNAYISKVCDEIETLRTFKTLSKDTDLSTLQMFNVVDNVSDYKIYRLLLDD